MALYGKPILVYDPGTISCHVNLNYGRDGKRTYRLWADLDDSEYTVADALPAGQALYSVDPGYSGFVVVDLNVRNGEIATWPITDGGDGKTRLRIWYADVQFGPFTNLLNSTNGDPTSQPARFRFQPNRIEKGVLFDVNNKLILNTAGVPFDPPPVKDATAFSLIVTRNEANPNFFAIAGWCDCVNLNQFGPFPPRTLKVGPIELPERLYSQYTGQLYYPMEYTFDVNPDTWDFQSYSQGIKELIPATSTAAAYLRPIEVDGEPTNDPYLLDPNGRKLAPPFTHDNVTIIRQQIYPTLDFDASFGFGNLFANNNAPPAGGS